MAVRQDRRFCDYCDRYTLHQKEIFGGAWGCLLTVLTFGLFIPIWILADVFGMFKPYRCQRCGEKN